MTPEFDPRIFGGMCAPKKAKRPPTPEALVMRDHMGHKGKPGYLALCRLGKVKRHNVGAFRRGDDPSAPRTVRCGEPGTSDLEIEIAGTTRSVFIELKKPGWKPPSKPKEGSAKSTWATYRHWADQEAFQARQRARGHVAFFSRSIQETYEALTAAGFTVPCPGPVRRTA